MGRGAKLVDGQWRDSRRPTWLIGLQALSEDWYSFVGLESWRILIRLFSIGDIVSKP